MDKYTKNFSENFRNLRKSKNFTQKQIAESLGFSEKTVSKWECGACVPDIGVLFGIADIFQTNIESLFGDEKMYLLGIDGGGTKTAFLLQDTEGNTIRTYKTDACNPIDIGLDNAKKILKDGIYKVCGDIPLSSVCAFAGIAGGSVADMKEKIEEFFKGLGFYSFENDSDNRNIIAAGLGNDDGMTVILGTGVCVYVQIGGKHKRVSGWGYLIDNGGSGYNLGRDALNAYFCAYDKTGGETLLTDEIDNIYPGGQAKLMGYIYSGGKKTIASFAPAVFSAFEKDDAIAKEILRRNALEVVRFIEAAAKEFKIKDIPVVFAGGLTKQKSFVEYITKALDDVGKNFQFKILDREPVEGAIILAKEVYEKREKNNA